MLRLESDAWSMAEWLRQTINQYVSSPGPVICTRYYIGWVGVGWQRRCKTRQLLRELDNQGTVVFLGGHHDWRSS